MSDPEKSLAERLEIAETQAAYKESESRKAKTAFLLAQAKERLKLKAIHEANGEKWSAGDREAELTIIQCDPDTDLGKAWMARNDAESEETRAKLDVRALSRAHWDEVKGR